MDASTWERMTSATATNTTMMRKPSRTATVRFRRF
jgi:hypothetical protein